MDLIIRKAAEGWEAVYGDRRWRCAIGKGGMRPDKREGDGASPVGRWLIREILYRPDKLTPPVTPLPVSPIDPADGWSDAPDSPEYNRKVRLPYGPSHEKLWREDDVYDIIGILGHNDDPVVPGAGSAVFLHVARPDYAPTEGCAALARDDLLALLADLKPGTYLRFEA